MIDTMRIVDPRAEALRETDQDRLFRQEGLLEYVAMMADVELPDEEEVTADE